MATEKTLTQAEAIKVLERLKFEAEFNYQPKTEKALEMAIEAMKELQDIHERCTDDGKSGECPLLIN